MIDLAKKEWTINMSKSILIGDQETDKMVAKKIKVKFYIMKKNEKINLKSIIKMIKN